jgi:annexin A7/11
MTAHTLDLDYILHFLSSYTCEQRIILVRDLEFEYEYKLIDMVLERPESPMRSCTLAMLIEPIELYVRDFHDLLILKQLNKIDYDISRKLVEILLTLNNDEIQKFKETYEHLFENSVEKDIEIVQGTRSIISNLLIQLLEGKRYEESRHSASIAKTIAQRLYEAGEGRPGIDYDTFIKIFTRDAFAQLSAIFDMYEDKYGRPIQEAIEREFQGQIDIECFQDMVEFTRSPGLFYSKILRQALDQTPIDYVTLIRIIIGHQDKDLFEICLEYSKIYDETLDQTIKTRIDIMEIKRLFVLMITNGHDIMANETDRVLFEYSNNSSPTGSGIISTISSTPTANGMRRNRSQEAFDKFVNMFKTMRPH